jgi:putative ubiquitin-RnfH superfamily antitoxin RatB of RatAB toxin-antitoxin module
MADAKLRVSVVYSPAPRETHEWQMELPSGSTVADAIAASPLRGEFPQADPAAMTVGIWGRKAAATQVLRERDRIEICRPLKVDPKVARRERFRRQGARAAGLFARKKD